MYRLMIISTLAIFPQIVDITYAQDADSGEFQNKLF